MKVRFGCCLALALAVCGAQASERADFTTGEGTNGWTISAAEYVSPTYAGAVDRISLSYSGTAAGSATVSALAQGGGESPVATLSAAANVATFDFPETTDFRAFRISTTGDWRLFSFAADVSATFLDAPSGLTVFNNTTGTSFDLFWMPVIDAIGYRVSVWTNVTVGVSAGTAVWQETFANSPAKTTTVNFKDEFTDNGTSGWAFEKAYASISEGAVRIGTTSDKGYLVSPSLTEVSGQNLTLRITAWRQTTSEGTDMPVGVVSDGVTNIVGVIALGDVPDTYHVALPSFNAGDRVALFSPTNKSSARAIIDDVAILSGYSEGHLEPSYIVNGRDVGDSLSCTLDNLPSVAVSCAVAALGRRGAVSANSVAVTVDLSNPDKIPVLNAFPFSDLEDGIYVQNFNSLAEPTLTSGDKEWLNGTTLSYWQSYKQNDSVRTFKYNGGAGTIGGLYALATSQNSSERALGGYSTRTDEICFGIAFTNDTDVTMKLSAVSYSAQQWGFKNTTNQTLSVSAALTGNLAWISDYDGEWTVIRSAQSNIYGSEDVYGTPSILTVTPTDISAISVRPGQILMLKWTIHSLKSGTPGMMAIDDLAVTFSRARALALHIY